MAFETYTNRVKVILDSIVAKFNAIPRDARTLALKGGDAMTFIPSMPISLCAIAETDAEVESLKDSETRFIDYRTTTLWEKTGETWASSGYSGQSTFLRPHTFVRSPWSQKMYFCDGYMRLSKVNLTTDPTPV